MTTFRNRTQFSNPELNDICLYFANHPPVGPSKLTGEPARYGGSVLREAFWLGYDGVTPVWLTPGTHPYAAWKAGALVKASGYEAPSIEAQP